MSSPSAPSAAEWLQNPPNENECPVCLDPIADTDIIGTVQYCLHYYHEHCITTWSLHSNSCPTCRRLYYAVKITAHNCPNQLRKTLHVQDKLPVNDAIDSIPAEFVVPAGRISTDESARNADATVSGPEPSSGLDSTLLASPVVPSMCTICSSSQYRPSWRMISCTLCLSGFHVRCLGWVGSVDIWYCPICDGAQEMKPEPVRRVLGPAGRTSPPRSRSSTSINSRITEAVFRNPTASNLYLGTNRSAGSAGASRTFESSGIFRAVVESDANNNRNTQPTRKSGLVIFNTNHELDETFSDEDEETTSAIFPPMNGGILLRRELRERQSLSQEESRSWDVFHAAKAENEDTPRELTRNNNSTAASNTSTSTGARRRRRRLADVKVDTPPTGPSSSSSSHATVAGGGRITSLISQFKSKQYESSSVTHPGVVGFSLNSIGGSIDGSPSLSPANLSPITAESDFSEEDLTAKRPCKPATLNLEQKNEIQKFLRNHLRPLYTPQDPTSSVIPTEGDYININKTLSRQIYQHILSLPDHDTIFNNPANLQGIVEEIFRSNLSLFKK